MLELVAHHILEKSSQIQNSKYFTIMADEITDVSSQEQHDTICSQARDWYDWHYMHIANEFDLRKAMRLSSSGKFRKLDVIKHYSGSFKSTKTN